MIAVLVLDMPSSGGFSAPISKSEWLYTGTGSAKDFEGFRVLETVTESPLVANR